MALGILALLIFPPLGLLYSIIGLSLSPKEWRKSLPFLILTIFIISYSYNPGATDLGRYFQLINNSGSMSLSQTVAFLNDGLLVENFLFWFVGHLGDFHILPAFSTSIVYLVSSLITCQVAEDFKLEKSIPYILMFQLLTLPFVSILNNLRNICAFSIFVYAVYRDFVKHKKGFLTYSLYVVPIFIHTVTIILLLVRILVPFSKRIKPVFLIMIFFIPNLIRFAYSNLLNVNLHFLFLNNIIRNSIIKFYEYYFDNLKDSYSVISANDPTTKLYKFLIILFAGLVVFLIYYTKSQLMLNEKYYNFNTFIFFICIVVFSCIPVVTPQFWRFGSILIVASGTILIPFISKLQKKISIVDISVIFCLIIIAGGLLYVQITQSVLLISFKDIFREFLYNNIFWILFKILKGFLMWSAV